MNNSIEITQEAFYALSPITDKAVKVEESEYCVKAYYTAKGVNLLRIFNHLSAVSQYYIQDINA